MDVEFLHSIIRGLWILFIVIWVVSAFTVKRAARKQFSTARLLFFGGVVAAVWFFSTHRRPWLNNRLIPDAPWAVWTGLILTVAGIGFAILARFFLGRNWDGRVVIKKDHTLITSGPYAYVRHPIYSGILLAILGSVIADGRAVYFAFFAWVLIGLWIKSRLEERLMVEQFGAQYIAYRERVKALIPGLW
jgi:protein-S-isoprenylcysteine O-methyltransferase Ste14